MSTSTTRLADIAERNSRGRLVDVAFAAMVAMLMVLALVSLRSVSAPHGATAVHRAGAVSAPITADVRTCAADGVC